MVAMRKGNGGNTAGTSEARKNSAFFQPLSVVLLFVVFSVLFFATAIMDIGRVEDLLLDALESKGFNIIEGVERISRNKFEDLMGLAEISAPSPMDVSGLESGFSMRESMAWNLIEMVREIDFKEAKGLLQKEAFPGMIVAEHLLGVAVFNDEGESIYRAGMVPEAVLAEVKPLLEGKAEILIDLFDTAVEDGSIGLVGLRRKWGGGTLLVVIGKQGLFFWGSRVAIQSAIEEGGWRKDTLYFAVFDPDGRLVAEAGEFPKTDPVDPEPGADGSTGKTGRHRLTSGDFKILEVYAPLHLEGGIAATARVGLDTGGMDGIIRENRIHILLSAAIMMGIGLMAIWLVYRNQNRHLSKLHEMGERLNQAERLSSLGHLAAGVAHEIRNPLNAIGMAAQRIKREFDRSGNGNPDELGQLTGIIRDEIRRMNGIVEDFLGLSRNRFELRSRSIVELLERLIHLIREEADSRNISIETRWENPDSIVYMDEDKMKQALLNIIKNAMESMTGHGVLGFRVGTYKKKHVVLRISDTGSGMQPDTVKQIFNPHFTTKDKGLGLGLPIAYEIIRAHGGELRVHSKPDKGTFFEILLPRERKPNEDS
ncbi:MAG: hypothetical protein C4530_03230 [Desulfobacteraceae bacterium]|nr:MAG: hypothetical protein C4530_03230 [Desulfobacteraceae bacterium]